MTLLTLSKQWDVCPFTSVNKTCRKRILFPWVYHRPLSAFAIQTNYKETFPIVRFKNILTGKSRFPRFKIPQKIILSFWRTRLHIFIDFFVILIHFLYTIIDFVFPLSRKWNKLNLQSKGGKNKSLEISRNGNLTSRQGPDSLLKMKNLKTVVMEMI